MIRVLLLVGAFIASFYVGYGIGVLVGYIKSNRN